MHENNSAASWSLPESTAFIVDDTPTAGRAVFCKETLSEKSLLLTTSSAISPISHVILRPYNKEVCSWCFAYDRGREWRIREISYNIVFCSRECQQTWDRKHDATCKAAMNAVETFSKQLVKRNGKDADGERGLASTVNPANAQELETFWVEIRDQGQHIFAARKSTKLTKTQRTALRKATELKPDIDILAYVLSGVIAAYHVSKNSASTEEMIKAEELLPSLFSLVPDDNVFIDNPMTASPLEDYAASYLILTSLLPAEMLDVISVDLVINLASRAAHNAFSIRPEGVTDGEQSGEFLGWGVWPEASFFNHSCAPNVRKERHGRQWSFFAETEAGQTIEKGQQLCITYLGGDERDLDFKERRKRLMEQWGFVCQCDKCVRESQEF